MKDKYKFDIKIFFILFNKLGTSYKPYGAKTELWYLDMYLVQNNPFLIYFSTFLKPNLDKDTYTN